MSSLCSNCLYAGLLLRSPSDSACSTLCRTSSTTWCLRWWSPPGTSWRTTWKQWVNELSCLDHSLFTEHLDTGFIENVILCFLCSPFVFSRRPTLMTCFATTPASWITAWRTACWPTPSFSGSSPNSWPSVSCSQAACRFVDVVLNVWKRTKTVSCFCSWKLDVCIF